MSMAKLLQLFIGNYDATVSFIRTVCSKSGNILISYIKKGCLTCYKRLSINNAIICKLIAFCNISTLFLPSNKQQWLI